MTHDDEDRTYVNATRRMTRDMNKKFTENLNPMAVVETRSDNCMRLALWHLPLSTSGRFRDPAQISKAHDTET